MELKPGQQGKSKERKLKLLKIGAGKES